MRLEAQLCRHRMSAARVAYLATTGHDNWPHLVPVTFAVQAANLFISIDQKPKSTLALRRLSNIAENPKVTVLTDHYDEDWSRLWWVRADGWATIVNDGPVREAAVTALGSKYAQYRAEPPHGPVIAIDVESWSGWSSTEPSG